LDLSRLDLALGLVLQDLARLDLPLLDPILLVPIRLDPVRLRAAGRKPCLPQTTPPGAAGPRRLVLFDWLPGCVYGPRLIRPGKLRRFGSDHHGLWKLLRIAQNTPRSEIPGNCFALAK
jgi:hypothetical protein